MQEADGGYLFLDEVHRLSYENQEKLFVFMDTGRYRPLGDKNWKAAKVRFILRRRRYRKKSFWKHFAVELPCRLQSEVLQKGR